RGTPHGLSLLHALPVRPAWLLGAGGTLAATGLAALIFSGTPADVVAYLLNGGVFISVGAGLGVVGGLQHWLNLRQAAGRAEQEEAELLPCIERLRRVLAERAPEQTVERLAEQLGLPEATVVRALVAMRRRGEIDEELNTQTGEWYYCLSPQPRLQGGHLD